MKESEENLSVKLYSLSYPELSGPWAKNRAQVSETIRYNLRKIELIFPVLFTSFFLIFLDSLFFFIYLEFFVLKSNFSRTFFKGFMQMSEL